MQVIEYEQKKLEILREAERKAADEQRRDEQAQREAAKRRQEWEQQMQRKQVRSAAPLGSCKPL
jgi:hypothetical protein